MTAEELLYKQVIEQNKENNSKSGIAVYRNDQTQASQSERATAVTQLLSQTDSLFSNVNQQRSNVANWLQTLYQNEWNKEEAIRSQEYNSATAQYARLLALGASHDAALAAIGAGGNASAATGTASTATGTAGINPIDSATQIASTMMGLGGVVSTSLENYQTQKRLAAADIVGEDANEVYSWREKGIVVPDEAKLSPENFKKWTSRNEHSIDPKSIKRDKEGNIVSFDWLDGAEMEGKLLTDADKLPYLFTHNKKWHDHYLKGPNARWNREQFRAEFAANIDPRGKTVLEKEGENRRIGQMLDNVEKKLKVIIDELPAIQSALMVGDFNAKGLTLLGPKWMTAWDNTTLSRFTKTTGASGEVSVQKFAASNYQLGTEQGNRASLEHLALFDENGNVKGNAPLIMQNWYYEIQNSLVRAKATFDAREDIYCGIKENASLQFITYQCQSAIAKMTNDAVSGLERKMTDSNFLNTLLTFHLICGEINYQPGQYLGNAIGTAAKYLLK